MTKLITLNDKVQVQISPGRVRLTMVGTSSNDVSRDRSAVGTSSEVQMSSRPSFQAKSVLVD